MSGNAGGGRDFRHPDEVLAFIAQIRERTRQKIDHYEQYLERAGELVGEGFSLDGSVRVQVDAEGAVSVVDIPDHALRRGNHLAEMILAAIHEAQAARALRLAELGVSLAGTRAAEMVQDAVPAQVREAVEERRESQR